MKFSIATIAIALLATANAQSVSSSLPKIPAETRVCDYQSKGYFFSTLRTYGPDSRAFCDSIGADLVNVNNSNFPDLTEMIVKCLGPGQKAWINSWDGNTFSDSPLAIWTGLQYGSGSININIQNEPLFAICAARHKDLSRPGLRPVADVASSASSASSADDTSSTAFAVPQMFVDPSGFPNVEEESVDENIDLDATFGFENLAEQAADEVLEDAVPENVVNDIAEAEEEPEDVVNEDGETDVVKEKVAEEEIAESNELVEDNEQAPMEDNM